MSIILLLIRSESGTKRKGRCLYDIAYRWMSCKQVDSISGQEPTAPKQYLGPADTRPGGVFAEQEKVSGNRITACTYNNKYTMSTTRACLNGSPDEFDLRSMGLT